MSDARTGLWLIGARGSVATTVATGLALITARGHGTDGLVTEQPELAAAGLVALDQLVVGGHDVVDVPLLKRAAQLADAGVIPHTALSLVHDELERTDSRVRSGYRSGHESQADAVERLAADIRAFRDAESLARVVVINVSSTEAVVEAHAAHESLTALEQAWAAGDSPLPPSAVYAAAAFTRRRCLHRLHPVDRRASACPRGARPATRRAVGWQRRQDGRDPRQVGARPDVRGPLAACALLGRHQPARRRRRRHPRRPAGHGEQGRAARPRGLEAMLGHPVDGPVHIDNIADLGDWKTAWDHLTFSGFLGTRMSMQFTWQGCDSSLAAPLVHRPRPARRPRPASRRGGPAAGSRLLLQGPGRLRRAPSLRAAARADGVGDVVVTRLRDLAELVRAPAALTVPGDSLAGAASAGWPAGSGWPAGVARPRCPSPPSASTGRAWRSTTGPTAMSTPSSARSGRSRRAGCPRAPRSASPVGLTVAGLTCRRAGRRTALPRPRGAARRGGVVLRPRPQAGPAQRGHDGLDPRPRRAARRERRRLAGPPAGRRSCRPRRAPHGGRDRTQPRGGARRLGTVARGSVAATCAVAAASAARALAPAPSGGRAVAARARLARAHGVVCRGRPECPAGRRAHSRCSDGAPGDRRRHPRTRAAAVGRVWRRQAAPASRWASPPRPRSAPTR